MYKFKILLLYLVMLLNLNIQSMDLVPKSTSRKVAAGIAIGSLVYASYKIFKACSAKLVANLNQLKIAQEMNSKCCNNFKINQDTVIAFDIHDVIAKYDVLKMVKESLLHPMIALSSLRHPGIFKMIAQQAKKGASVQEMFEAIENAYPDNAAIQNITKLSINIAAQLKPIQETINIAKKLIANGYKVVFVSNMEPKLFERFIEDFPEFKDCKAFLPSPENQWLKKPSQEYFRMVSNDIQTADVIFIDDRLKNVKEADACGISSLVYLSPSQLKTDLIQMGAIL